MYDHAGSLVQVARDRVQNAGLKPLWSHIAGWLCVVIVYSMGAMAAGGEVWLLPWTAAVLGVGLLGSFFVGQGFVLLLPRHDRRYASWVWLRSLPILHGPWLVIGGFTAFGAAVAGVARVLLDPAVAGTALWGIGLCAFFVWLVLLPVWVFAWAASTRAAAARLGVGGRAAGNGRAGWRVGTLVWAVVVVLVCGVVGLGGGGMGFWFAMDVAGAGGFAEWDF